MGMRSLKTESGSRPIRGCSDHANVAQDASSRVRVGRGRPLQCLCLDRVTNVVERLQSLLSNGPTQMAKCLRLTKRLHAAIEQNPNTICARRSDRQSHYTTTQSCLPDVQLCSKGLRSKEEVRGSDLEKTSWKKGRVMILAHSPALARLAT
jgi:hypothetical protein